MSVAHNFPSQKLSRAVAGPSVRIAGVVIAGFLGLIFLQPLAVSAETDHQQTAKKVAAAEPAKQEAEAATPARKPVRVIQIWNVPAEQARTN